MSRRFSHWEAKSNTVPASVMDAQDLIYKNRKFKSIAKLEYGDHGLPSVERVIVDAIKTNKKIALYADYDVDGTMSCVSWMWFLESIGFHNFVHHIPCRFSEGYGLNLAAVKKLIHEDGAKVIITMDTGITANEEAAYCAAQDVSFICTDHHKIQPDKMPDCHILNPKMHPDAAYQELCGCGITFVLLRRLGLHFEVPASVWTDILGLTGMATICDVVPLNPVNHQLAKVGVQALVRSKREILVKLKKAASLSSNLDEQDIGFRLGPRINAVGRLEHADKIVEAFSSATKGESADALIDYMDKCNEERKSIQAKIYEEALILAQSFKDDPILFLGGDWHPGVVGIAASKIAEKFWKPTWLFNRGDDTCKGSARAISGFDVTAAMMQTKEGFLKFGGHAAAGGFSFSLDKEAFLREALNQYANSIRQAEPSIWQSRVSYDFQIPGDLVSFDLVACLDGLKPFGHGFEEPVFMVASTIKDLRYYNNKETGEPKHTAVTMDIGGRYGEKVMFFNQVLPLQKGEYIEVLLSASKSYFRGKKQLSLIGKDYRLAENHL